MLLCGLFWVFFPIRGSVLGRRDFESCKSRAFHPDAPGGRSSTSCWRQVRRATPSRTSFGIPGIRSASPGPVHHRLAQGGDPSDPPARHQRVLKPFSRDALLIVGPPLPPLGPETLAVSRAHPPA